MHAHTPQVVRTALNLLLGACLFSMQVEQVITQLKKSAVSAGISAVVTTAVALASVALPPSALAVIDIGRDKDTNHESSMERVASSNPLSIQVL